MELTLKKQPVIINENLLSSTLEQSIELDATLPDYYPDIMKIVSCVITPAIGMVRNSGDRIVLEGGALVCVVYTDAEDELYAYEGNVPFEKVVELKTAVSDPIVCVDANVSYVNCRAVSGRRLDVRGAINIPVKVDIPKECLVVSDIEEQYIETKISELENVYLSGQCMKQFTIKEELSPISGKPAISRILRKHCSAVATDVKLISGKAVIKGEMYLTLLYTNEETDIIENMHYTLPFSQIADCRFVDENSLCSINFRIISSSVEAVTDDEVTIKSLLTEITCCCDLTVIKSENISVLEDCYSSEYNVIPTFKELSVCDTATLVDEDVHISETIELPEDTTEICDYWIKSITYAPYCEGDLVAHCKIVIGMTVIANDMQHLERVVMAQIPLNVSCEDGIPRECLCVGVKKCSVNLNSQNSCQFHLDCIINGYALNSNDISLIESVTIEDLAVPIMSRNSVYIYYPYTNESLWVVAKKFGTTVAQIQADNNLKSNYVNKGDVLIITPKKRA